MSRDALCPLPEQLPLWQARRLLVFAPHPDDECLGCGGAIALAVRAGAQVRVVLVSDGSGAGDLPAGTAAVRQQEFRRSLEVLGVLDGWALGFPDGELSTVPGLHEAIKRQMREFRPDWVLGPAAQDLHADHRAVALAVRDAAAEQVGLQCLCEYESWGPVPITHVLDIGAVLETKVQAIEAHATALAYGNYLEAARGQASYRSLLHGGGCVAAEAYACWRPHEGQPPFGPSQSAELTRLRAREQELAVAQNRLVQEHAAMTASLSWRVTAPLRRLRSWIGHWLAPGEWRRLHRAVPLSPRTRQRLKCWLASRRWGAHLLRGFESPRASGLSTAEKETVRAQAEARLDAFLASGQTLVLPSFPGTPKVTVLVVLFNQAGLSLMCLEALLTSRHVSYELVLVDNGSTDRVPQLLECVKGATIVRPGRNLGFLHAVNLASSHARGDLLLLLNNDALVFEDTLARGARRLATGPEIGAVGGQIMWWDGRLQEAGSIIWRDASCLGYGRGHSPDDGAYRFVRDVDYCSGALLMVRRHLFESLGGFDPDFAPAYYEETDLCVRLWQSGHRVVFDPTVKVRHFEFASESRKGEALTLQARNREVFATKHSAFLAAQQSAGHGAQWVARQRLRPGQRRVLVIDDRVPLPSLGRGYPRQRALIQALVTCGAVVTFYPLLFPQESWLETYEALPEEVEVMQGLGLAGLHDFLATRRDAFDIVLVSRPHNMEVINRLRRRYPDWLAHAYWVYDAEALYSDREALRAQVLDKPLTAPARRRLVQAELALMQRVDAVLAVSAHEAERLRAEVKVPVHVLGHALHTPLTTTGFEGRSGFLFVGAMEADDSPNTDSILWFLREVWPLLQVALGPDAQLDLVGPCDSSSVPALAGPGVKVWGRVESLTTFYERARVFIAPTRFAAGIPHKAHEAAAAGVPMVVSELIARQLGWGDACLARAGNAKTFAQECIDLYRDERRWWGCREQARAATERDCSPEVFMGTVRDLLSKAQGVRPATQHTTAKTAFDSSSPT